MTRSIVLDLQRDALAPEISITNLLRKALVVARKLNLSGFATWINNELDGYTDYEAIPQYRQIHGQLQALDPYQGWVSAMINDGDMERRVSNRRMGQPLSEIEGILNHRSSNSALHFQFPTEQRQILCKAFKHETEFALLVQYSALVRIVEAVRTTILNWSLQLEQDGILGEGLSFTLEERKAAAESNYQINNFFGESQSAQILQSSPGAVAISGDLNLNAVQETMQLIAKELANLGLNQAAEQTLQADVGTINAQLGSPQPKRSIIHESLKSIRTVLEGAAGGAAGQLIVEIGKLLLKQN